MHMCLEESIHGLRFSVYSFKLNVHDLKSLMMLLSGALLVYLLDPVIQMATVVCPLCKESHHLFLLVRILYLFVPRNVVIRLTTYNCACIVCQRDFWVPQKNELSLLEFKVKIAESFMKFYGHWLIKKKVADVRSQDECSTSWKRTSKHRFLIMSKVPLTVKLQYLTLIASIFYYTDDWLFEITENLEFRGLTGTICGWG